MNETQTIERGNPQEPMKGRAPEVPSGGEIPYQPLINRFTDATSNIWAENRVLRFFAVCILIATLIFGYLVLTAMDRVKTIVVPFGQGVENLYIVGDTPSESYLFSISRNVIQLAGTYTSSGIEFQLDEVLKLVHPSRHGDMRETFRADVARLKAFREISFATYVRYNEEFDFSKQILRVPVRRERFVGKSRTSDSGFYQLDYLVEDGRFWLTDIQFVRKGEVQNEQLSN